jgi:hypothetical protein
MGVESGWAKDVARTLVSAASRFVSTLFGPAPIYRQQQTTRPFDMDSSRCESVEMSLDAANIEYLRHALGSV